MKRSELHDSVNGEQKPQEGTAFCYFIYIVHLAIHILGRRLDLSDLVKPRGVDSPVLQQETSSTQRKNIHNQSKDAPLIHEVYDTVFLLISGLWKEV